MSLRERRDGEHIGPKGTVSARKIAEMLGLKDAPPPEPPMPDTPAAARLRGEGKARAADELMAAAKDSFKMRTVRAGREAMDALGVRPEELPVGVEADMGPPPKPEPKQEGWSTPSVVNGPSEQEAIAAEAEELRARYREHAAAATARAEQARGDAQKEARAAAEVREVAELGSQLKSKLEKLGMAL